MTANHAAQAAPVKTFKRQNSQSPYSRKVLAFRVGHDEHKAICRALAAVNKASGTTYTMSDLLRGAVLAVARECTFADADLPGIVRDVEKGL